MTKTERDACQCARWVITNNVPTYCGVCNKQMPFEKKAEREREEFIELVLKPNHATETSAWDRIGYTAWQARAQLDRELRDKVDNLIIAIGMGWDLDGVVEEVQKVLSRTAAS